MKKEDKKRLATAVLAKDCRCSECGKIMFNSYDLPYAPKVMPNDAAVVVKRGDNDKNWVMCAGCAQLQNQVRVQRQRKEANAMMQQPPQTLPFKERTPESIKHQIHLNEVGIKVLLEQYNVTPEHISLIKKTMNQNFHLKYYLKHGKFPMHN